MPLIRLVHKLLAALLVGSGALGGVFGIVMGFLAASEGWREVGTFLLFAAVFALPLYAGVLLWRGRCLGRRLAATLFATQIPIIEMPAFSVSWYTGVSLGPVFTRMEESWQVALSFGIGVGGQLDWGNEGDGMAVGVNAFALLAALFLFWSGRRSAPATVEAVSR